MQLPGGIIADGQRRQDYAFRPLTGHVELALGESSGWSLPQQVTRALVAALAHVGGRAADSELVAHLAVADRQFLVRQLSARLNPHPTWLTCACGRCEGQFDIAVREAELPCKPAGPGYPEMDLPELGVRVRVPTGADQEQVVDLDDAEAARQLFALLVRPLGPARRRSRPRSAALEQAVEAAIEAMAPEAATELEAQCPECGASQRVGLSPYLCLQRSAEAVLDQVHALASAYHWSEESILALTLERRFAYLRRIERARGLYGAEPRTA